MAVRGITVRNFRCFAKATFTMTSWSETPAVTIIQGANGSGKTSLLEALHYGCHLRSFRTHLPAQLACDTTDVQGFSITITTQADTLHIAVADKKRSIKINGNTIAHYNELIKVYKVVTFIEDDLLCIKGYPETRRSLIDTALSVQEPEYHKLLRAMQKIIDQRTKIIQDHRFHEEQYQVWTDQLIKITQKIVSYRKSYLELLQEKINEITKLYDTQGFLKLSYREKRPITAPEDIDRLRDDELQLRRNLYGPHLDDIDFLIHQKNSRSFASRGQQKLAVMFLKIAQAQLLLGSCPPGTITFLLDDFLTDFDQLRITKILQLLFNLQVQLIITTPAPHALLYDLCQTQPGFSHIALP